MSDWHFNWEELEVPEQCRTTEEVDDGTVVINTDILNFREDVEKFTGMHSSSNRKQHCNWDSSRSKSSTGSQQQQQRNLNHKNKNSNSNSNSTVFKPTPTRLVSSSGSARWNNHSLFSVVTPPAVVADVASHSILNSVLENDSCVLGHESLQLHCWAPNQRS